MHTRLSEYRAMWVLVLFDLPVDTIADKRAYTRFRKVLLKDGFTMLQYSVYVRHCASEENATVHEDRVEVMLPELGHISILRITDRQYGAMRSFYGDVPQENPGAPKQLEMF